MFKKGQIVIKILVGGGVKTATIQKVKAVKKGVVTLEDCGTLSWDNKTGREIEPAIMGFYSELVCLDGGEEEKIKL